MKKGLFAKYTIFNNESGLAVEGFCFVLKPETDPAAWDALWTYASSSDVNDKLRTDLLVWLMENKKPLAK